MDKTVFALSTPCGKSAIAVIRITGRLALQTIQRLSGKNADFFAHRRASVVLLQDGRSIDAIDHVVVTYFAAPNSFTGEDIVEIACHGSSAVIRRILDTLAQYEGLRFAEPGEFTKRAFLNGKMDLLQVEALADLIESETDLQRKVALRQVIGVTSKLYEHWHIQIVRMLASVEALIDFPEDDIPHSIMADCITEARSLLCDMENLLQNSSLTMLIATGVRTAIFGPPNAGKSSVMNMLAKDDIAIVSEIAGTTRDVIRVKMDLKGIPLIVFDTAGIRSATDDIIEAEGIRRAQKVISEASLRICVIDINDILDQYLFLDNNQFLDKNQDLNNSHDILTLNMELLGVKLRFLHDLQAANITHINTLICNKVDLLLLKKQIDIAKVHENIQKVLLSFIQSEYHIMVDNILLFSALPDEKFEQNRQKLLKMIEQALNFDIEVDNNDIVANLRQKNAVNNAINHLKIFINLFTEQSPLDICSAELRLVAQEVQKVVGVISTDEVLTMIFERFCIGK